MKFNYKQYYLMTLLVIGIKKPNRKQFHKYLRNKKFLFAIFGLILAILSIVAHCLLPSILKTIIEKRINLEKDSEFYKWWVRPSTPTEVGIYFFHIENPYDFQNGAKVLKVKEMGKYMFKQYYERVNISYSPNKDTITFYERKTYVFDQNQTIGSLDDNITVINVPLAALGSIVPNVIDHLPFSPLFSSVPYNAFNKFLDSHQQSLFINTTIRELIYGYRLNILDTAEHFADSFGFEAFAMSDVMPSQTFPNNSFGIFNGRNATLDGPFEMYTGIGGANNLFGHIKSWHNQTELKWWKSDKCNAINGTDGTIWPPSVHKKERLYFYVPDICRSIYVTYDSQSDIKGIKTLKYTSSDDVLGGIEENPENECFCADKNSDRCHINGIFDMSSCQSNIPIIVSLPHFLGVDPIITDRIEGLKPDPNLHRPVIHVEPTLGAVIHGDSRLQISIRISKNSFLNGFQHLHSEMYVPLFWGYKKLGISDGFAAELKSRLFKPITIIRYLIIMGIISGFLLCAVFLLTGFLSQKEAFPISIYENMNESRTVPNNINANNNLDTIYYTTSFELESLMKPESGPETNV